MQLAFETIDKQWESYFNTGFVLGQWEGGELERGGRCTVWSRDVADVRGVPP